MSSRFPVRFVGVALVSLATLLLELTLTRLFSATMFYHFAFLAISLALFGSGASALSRWKDPPRRAPSSRVGTCPRANGITSRSRRSPAATSRERAADPRERLVMLTRLARAVPV